MGYFMHQGNQETKRVLPHAYAYAMRHAFAHRWPVIAQFSGPFPNNFDVYVLVACLRNEDGDSSGRNMLLQSCFEWMGLAQDGLLFWTSAIRTSALTFRMVNAI